MSRKIITAVIIIISVSLCGCRPSEKKALTDTSENPGQETSASSDRTEEKIDSSSSKPKEKPKKKKPDLKQILINEAGIGITDLIDFSGSDFDCDGQKEAFAITGSISDEERSTVEGSLWFVSQSGAQKLTDSKGLGFNSRLRTMTMGNTTYVLVDEMYETAALTYVYSVSDGRAVEALFSGRGEVITDLDGPDRFRIMDSSYDMMFDEELGQMIGHTWKHYYYFYDPTEDGVFEYAGTDILPENIEYICQRDLVGELIGPKDSIDSMFLRGNGLLVINFRRPAEGGYDLCHYIYDITTGDFVDDCKEECGTEPQGGICLPCLCPDIASYPELPVP